MRSRNLVIALALFAFAVPAHALRMSAWVPSWDTNALEVMRVQAGNLDETNPGWYTLAPGGGITKNYKAEDPGMRAALTGTQLVPTIKNYVNGGFDGAMVATIVGDATLREKHAEALTQLVVDQNFAGIDVDYESVPTTARANFSAFIELLAGKLHASNRVLSVTVHAKTSDASTRNGPGAQDWAAIGRYADSVKIMAYDSHWSTSAAGAITPLDWLDQVAAYAESSIPAGKAIIGLPWYGYDWLEKKGTSVTYAQAMDTAQRVGAIVDHDANGEATYSYDGRTVYFQDAAAYRAKVNLVTTKHPKIGGFAHWRVGAEDPAIWPIVRELVAQSGIAPTAPARQDFAVDAPAELQVVAGAQALATIGYTGIDSFSSAVSVDVVNLDLFAGTATLSSVTVTKTATSTLLVTVPFNTPAGSYRLKVMMTGAGLSRQKVITVNVTAPKTSKRRAA